MLTKKGWEIFDKWSDIYFKELKRIENDPTDPYYGESGWCIVDTEDFVKDIDDEAELLIFGEADNVLNHLKDYKEHWGNDEYAFGHSAQNIIDILFNKGYVKED